MTTLHSNERAKAIQERLERDYLEALTYLVRYHSGRQRAQETFDRLQRFRAALGSAAAPAPDQREAA